MTGTFLGRFDPNPPKHKCDIPKGYAESVENRWLVWQCECGKAYRLVPQTQYNENFQQWERFPEQDQKTPAREAYEDPEDISVVTRENSWRRNKKT